MALAQEQNPYAATHADRPNPMFRLDVPPARSSDEFARRTRLEPQGKTVASSQFDAPESGLDDI
jgi:hypothetical protein